MKKSFRPRKYDITYLLASAAECQTPNERVQWLESLLTWVRGSGSMGNPPSKPSDEHLTFNDDDINATRMKTLPSTRLRFILHLCNRQPEWRDGVSATLAQLVAELPATELFCEVGIFSGHGLIGQIFGILVERYLPLNGGRGDLDQLVTVLFPTDDDANWVEWLSDSKIKQLLMLMECERGPAVWQALRCSFADSMLIMASQVMGAGTERVMRERVPARDLSTSAFFRLLMAIQRLHPRLEGSAWVTKDDLLELANLQSLIRECLTVTDQAFTYLEKNGVSVDLVFRFERTERLLKRLQLMSNFLMEAARGSPESGLSKLLAELIRSSLDAHRLDHLFSGKIRLLSRRIVDHTGDSGDHYIMRDRKGYFQMLLSAAGGGFLTVGTTVLKASISRFPLPPMLSALAHTCNYSGSFLLMHFCHLTLATKQPSMTASTLARKLSEYAHGSDSDEIIATIRNAFRSQFAAAIGNVGVAIPTAALVTWLYQNIGNQHIFTANYAHKTLLSLNPFTTLTIPFAILTGFLLWAASLFSGAVENWIALHKISQRIEFSPYLRFWLGSKKTARLVRFLTKNIAGVTGSIVLGFLLAFTPFVAVITGIPLDVRHVTLSSAALSVAVVTLGKTAELRPILYASLGVGVIGLMNFGISFFLALVVASRAQNVRRGLLNLIARQVVRSFLRSPLAFFWPVRDTVPQQIRKQ